MKGRSSRQKTLQRLRVRITTESEDAVTCLMESVFRRPVSIYTDVRRDRSWATVYLPSPSAGAQAHRRKLLVGLRAIQKLGLDLPRIYVSASRLATEDWAESWKRHFKPLVIGNELLVVPSWSRRQPAKNQQAIVLDPGLSFGTGQHPTTRFCLEEIVAARGRTVRPALLDIGCGSGILAIAAARLGYALIEAFDFDPQAVRVASGNAASNGVRRRLKITCGDLKREPVRPPRTFDVVCANLTSDLLIGQARKIVTRVAPEGTLVLAGILVAQFTAVRQAFHRLGFQLLRSQTKGEWQSGSFARRGRDRIGV